MLPRTHADHDKLFKVRPFITAVKNNMRKINFEEFSSVDEIIIPFKGRTFMKQYNKNKPHKWGIKMFAIACRIKFSGVLGIGTVCSNRLANCKMNSDTIMQKQGRGVFDSKVDTVNNIVVTK